MDSTEPRREDAQEPSDEALVRAVARGDHGALGALHRRYAAR
jgi:hypothetical protein